MEQLEKQTVHKFGEHYLIGKDSTGTKYYLKAPSWDCGWYWGFGYIRTYTNNAQPTRSRDISSHFHADNFYSFSENLTSTVYTEDEQWALFELFKNFYTLRNLAKAQASEGKEGNFTSKRHGFDYRTLIREGVNINKDCIPQVMAKIVSILTGENAEELEGKYKAMVK